MDLSQSFSSATPVVRLTKAFTTPFRNVVATARTCYSSNGIVDDERVGEPDRFSPLAKSIYDAGHHTTFQHAHFQFAISNVSRHFIWSFLHSHQFYNSEQVSQRYVTVKPDAMTIPRFNDPEMTSIFTRVSEMQFEAYQRLCEILVGPVESDFFRRFHRSERNAKKHSSAIQKKAQEVARYVLPIGTHAYLYHTVSAITLLRYWRMANQLDVPVETRLVVGEMVRQVLAHDPEYEIVLQEPLDIGSMPEDVYLSSFPELVEGIFAWEFRNEFDGTPNETCTSKLISYDHGAQAVVADAVRTTLGLVSTYMSDLDAIDLLMNPARNTLLGESLNLTTISKISRAAYHAHYTFKKKLSHTADSQDQRHRMTPASRPVLSTQFDHRPDYIVPELLKHSDEGMRLYRETMNKTWQGITRLRGMGASTEMVSYLLPNAVAVRFTESSDLLNLMHKYRMRLCYNAQEEIWRSSVDEVRQIRDVHPHIGKYLLPPCGLRDLAKVKPICPEGGRYCGVTVWKKDIDEYERIT